MSTSPKRLPKRLPVLGSALLKKLFHATGRLGKDTRPTKLPASASVLHKSECLLGKVPRSRRAPRSEKPPPQEGHPARKSPLLKKGTPLGKAPSSRRALCLEESPIEEEHPLGIAARSEKSPTRKSPPLERRAPPRECPNQRQRKGWARCVFNHRAHPRSTGS